MAPNLCKVLLLADHPCFSRYVAAWRGSRPRVSADFAGLAFHYPVPNIWHGDSAL